MVVLVAAALAGVWLLRDRSGRVPAGPAPSGPAPEASAFRTLVFPTDQAGLLQETGKGVFQATASGNPQSALYGSVRTVKSGKGLASSFHEGIDIAPLRRDARGLPLDRVYAVADGKVGYVNRQSGNSNYGIYVVVLHKDPVGEVYTLYAHLAAVDAAIRDGSVVRAGMVLGRMGNTPAATIPSVRSHLHFEAGLLMNARFGDWFRGRRLQPDHGMFNGLNMLALDPLALFRSQRRQDAFSVESFLREVPVAFEVLVPMKHRCDYFRRYPALWQGGEATGGWVVLACSENGTPLRGRAASELEIRANPSRKPAVLKVDEGVLGRNGCHLVRKEGASWKVGTKGERWLEILTYP